MTKQMSKKAAAIAAVLLSSALSSVTAAAAPAVIQAPASSVKTDARATAHNGRISVPLSDLAKAIDARLVWNPAKGTLTLSKWNRTFTFAVGSRQYDDGMNAGQKPLLLEPVRSIGGKAYIEATFLRTLGYRIGYAGNKLTIASPLGEKDADTLYKGDLAEARQKVMTIAANGELLRYDHKELETTAGETSDQIFLFPQGEALRFYMMYGDTVSFVQFKDGFPVVTAQAHVKEGEGAFKQLLGGKATGAVGKFPRIDKPFLAYASHIFGEGTSRSSGRVESDGTYVSLGSEYRIGGQISQSEGKMAYVLNGEKRTDRR